VDSGFLGQKILADITMSDKSQKGWCRNRALPPFGGSQGRTTKHTKPKEKITRRIDQHLEQFSSIRVFGFYFVRAFRGS
jgi:hypothetical protein